MAKILILIGGHLCTAPRPQKEAETLVNAGHDVTVCGFWFDAELVERDRLLIQNKSWRFEPIVDFRPNTINGRWQNWQLRLQRRLANERFQHFGSFSPELLGYGVKKMLHVARQAQADLTIVHSEAGLWVANQLLDAGFRVGVDFEDWFSQDLLPEHRATRPIAQISALESRLARDCRYCLTTSQALAEALATAYKSPKPAVVYNVFPDDRTVLKPQKCDRQNLNLPSLHWFSQTIGPGRGLETLFQALPYLKISVEIHLRGNYSDRQWLELQIPPLWRDRVFIHPTVPNAELLACIAEHDIGLALECVEIPSRNLTVTNKLFQYLQASLAVIATNTAGQYEIFSQYQVGKLIPANDPAKLADAIADLLTTPNQLERAKTQALKAVQDQFCWEKQAHIILQSLDFALNS